ncbi:MAG: hypothetical protein ABW221_16870 [Vicinamibacteria bacterium]
MDRTLCVTLLLCAAAAPVSAAEKASCDQAISTDVALSRTDDADTPYEARVLIREERTDAFLAFEYRLSRGVPISSDITGGKSDVFPPMRVSLALAEDGSDVRYAVELMAAGAVCRSHRGLVPLAPLPQREAGPRFVPLSPR